LIGIEFWNRVFQEKRHHSHMLPQPKKKMYTAAVNGIIMNMKRRHLIHDKTTKTSTTTNNNIDNDER